MVDGIDIITRNVLESWWMVLILLTGMFLNHGGWY